MRKISVGTHRVDSTSLALLAPKRKCRKTCSNLVKSSNLAACQAVTAKSKALKLIRFRRRRSLRLDHVFQLITSTTSWMRRKLTNYIQKKLPLETTMFSRCPQQQALLKLKKKPKKLLFPKTKPLAKKQRKAIKRRLNKTIQTYNVHRLKHTCELFCVNLQTLTDLIRRIYVNFLRNIMIRS